MRISALSRILAAAGAVAVTGWAGEAFALEDLSPYLPTISVGAPVGALPPPGYYAGDQNVLIRGHVNNAYGDTVQVGPGKEEIGIQSYLNIPSVLWVIPKQVLGATYGVAVVQPYVQQSLAFGPGGSAATQASGLFNTIIVPLNMSWQLPWNLFADVAFGIYFPDGYSKNTPNPGPQIPGVIGPKVVTLNNIANNFWTFEPGIALSWLSNGWDITGHLVFDFNTENTDTKYQSGNVGYFDYTFGKTLGKWSVGVGGNFTQQGSGDKILGTTITAPGGGRLRQAFIGPFAGYDFGPATLAIKYMYGFAAQNAGQVSFLYLNAGFPF
jgi:hypothetical protein